MRALLRVSPSQLPGVKQQLPARLAPFYGLGFRVWACRDWGFRGAGLGGFRRTTTVNVLMLAVLWFSLCRRFRTPVVSEK